MCQVKCSVTLCTGGKQYYLPIVIANYDAKPTLLGKNWLRQIKLEWGEILSVSSRDSVSSKNQLNDLLSKHSELFTESYEGMKGLEAHITMKGDAKPIFVKARAHRVPYALKEQVEKELDKLEKHGVITKTVGLAQLWSCRKVITLLEFAVIIRRLSISQLKMSNTSCPLPKIYILH